MQTVKARTMRRRRRIPAFGEWNTTDCYHGGSSGREWPAAITPCFEFELAKPWIPPCTAEVTAMRSSGAVVGKQQRKGEARQGRRIRRVPDVGPNAASKVYYISVVDDDDLYEITPSMLPHKSMEVRR
uniref:Uncharacterized protein n=1 Tax=Oryza brachyantha TaxID=4533 RepID=J3N7U9_ORYBR